MSPVGLGCILLAWDMIAHVLLSGVYDLQGPCLGLRSDLFPGVASVYIPLSGLIHHGYKGQRTEDRVPWRLRVGSMQRIINNQAQSKCAEVIIAEASSAIQLHQHWE